MKMDDRRCEIVTSLKASYPVQWFLCLGEENEEEEEEEGKENRQHR